MGLDNYYQIDIKYINPNVDLLEILNFINSINKEDIKKININNEKERIFARNLIETIRSSKLITYKNIDELLRKSIDSLFKELDIKSYIDIIKNYDLYKKRLPYSYYSLTDYNRRLRTLSKNIGFSYEYYNTLSIITDNLKNIIEEKEFYRLKERDIIYITKEIKNFILDKQNKKIKAVYNLYLNRFKMNIALDIIFSPLANIIINNYLLSKKGKNYKDYAYKFINTAEALPLIIDDDKSMINFLKLLEDISFYLPEDYIDITEGIIKLFNENKLNKNDFNEISKELKHEDILNLNIYKIKYLINKIYNTIYKDI
ncbi:diguanylate cyclase [Nanobdella aerobiophila]|uniref:Diguanylate cyclase n=1 Tax=Nanobdella aerobiophila TaxID=2586965 RepID=A0A915WST6_9ARCH|nr:hypothetical protein [Nanobdella aerobiophila]BBL45640.1 diguanylate cyclase [Nanobdella aerobiophila]